MKWIKIGKEIGKENNLPKNGGHYWIFDEFGQTEALFTKKYGWKTIDRPIKNALGVQVFRADLNPTHWMNFPSDPT
jgi:hypothetical protein